MRSGVISYRFSLLLIGASALSCSGQKTGAQVLTVDGSTGRDSGLSKASVRGVMSIDAEAPSDAGFEPDAMSMSPLDAMPMPELDASMMMTPDSGEPNDPCEGVGEGSIISTGMFSMCSDFASPCSEAGTQQREVVVCRGGMPVTEMESQNCTAMRTGCEDGILTRRIPNFPRIHDYSGAPESEVNLLVQRAVNGLGLSIATAPELRDRIFVGRWYMAWIDETGFYGKMNALWSLNGDPSNLEFTMLDGSRPVNVFVVGEHGQGQWPPGYMGSEHIEYPNNVPEFDDDPNCANGLCAQYSLSEADPYTDTDIPTWIACNFGSPSFSAQFVPIELEEQGNGIRLMYEGRLRKRGDFGGSTNGSNCHDDYLFSDNRRRSVYLRVGYKLSADEHFIDRLHQVRNPAGNPDFDGPESFIGGFVMTAWPNPHPLKQLNKYAKAGAQAQGVNWGTAGITISNTNFTRLPTNVPTSDIVLGWSGQAMTLSPYGANVNGRAFTLSNEGPQDNRDTGFCFCYVHGGIEMGGGLLHGSRHTDGSPIQGGTTSYVAVRRLQIRHEDPVPPPFSRVYEAETDLSHAIGMLETDGWSASTMSDQAGHLAFGPYAADWPEETLNITYRLMVDVADNRPEIVATIDIFDATSSEIVASRPLGRNEFSASFQYTDFTITADLAGRGGHRMETRVYWHDISYVRLDKVTISQ